MFSATRYRHGRNRFTGTRQNRNPNNVLGIATSTNEGRNAASAFFNGHQGYTLIFSVGNRQHDVCVFIQQNGQENQAHFNILVYNCNENDRLGLLEDFLRLFIHRNALMYHTALHQRENDQRGVCAALTWLEIYLTFLTGTSPFNRNLVTYPIRPN